MGSASQDNTQKRSFSRSYSYKASEENQQCNTNLDLYS